MEKKITESLRTYAGSCRCRFSAVLVAALHVVNLTFVPAGTAALRARADVPQYLASLPLEVARVQESYFSDDPAAPRVIILQNAHANYEAQKNIGEIIAYYQKTHALDSVCLEGSVGEIDTSFFRAFPLEEKKRAIIDDYVRAGRISGAEERAIIAEAPLELFGVEDEELYVAHIKTYVEHAAQREEIEDFLSELAEGARQISREHLNPELHAFVTARQVYAAGDTDSLEYVRHVLGAAKRAAIDLARFPAFERLEEIAVFQAKIDPVRLTRQTERLVRDDLLTRDMTRDDLDRLAYHELDLTAGRIEPFEYYAFLKTMTARYALDIREYEQVNRYYHYTRLSDDIDPKALFAQRQQLESLIIDSMCRNKEEKEIVRFLRVCRVLERVLRLRAVPDDIAWFESEIKAWPAARISAFIRRYTARAVSTDVLRLVPVCQRFYEYAHERDERLIENTLAYLQKKKKRDTLLTVGGYHSAGITRALSQRNISYVLVSPRLRHMPREDRYHTIMSGYGALFGIREGSRGGTVEKFSEISALPHSRINAPLVNTLLAEIRQKFLDEIVHAGTLADGEPIDTYYRTWNKNVKDWTIVPYDSDGQAFFIHHDTFLKALRAYSSRELRSLIAELGIFAAPRPDLAAPDGRAEYEYRASEHDMRFFSEKTAAYGLDREQIEEALARREATGYMQSYGFGPEGILPAGDGQLGLIQHDLRRVIAEKKKKQDHTLTVYAIGLGEYPKEIVQLVRAFDDTITRIDGENAARWQIDVIGIDVNKKAIAAAHAVFSAYHANDFQVFFKQPDGEHAPYFTGALAARLRSDFFQADTLDGQRLAAIGRARKADYIVNRYGPSDNLGVAGGGIAADKVETYKLGKILNAYFSLYNLVSAFAKAETRYITEPVNLFTIGSIAMKPEKDIPVLRFAGAELLSAATILGKEDPAGTGQDRDESLIDRGTGIYRILYPAFMADTDLKSFFDLIEAQKDISVNPRVRALTPAQREKIRHTIRYPKGLTPVTAYTDEPSLARRDEATGLKPKLNPVIIENLKRGEMLVFKRLEMNRLIDTIAEYLEEPSQTKKETIINMMIYGIHLKQGEPDYRTRFSEWFRDVEENRLRQYFEALLFIRELLGKTPPQGLLKDASVQESAFALLQRADTRYMVLPSFMDAGALGHIGDNGIYLSLQAITQAVRDTERDITYNGIDIETIVYALLLHEASDYASGGHSDNITSPLFHAIDLFWQSLSTQEDAQDPGRIISLQATRKAMTRHVRETVPFFVFESALVTEAYVKMHSRLLAGEDDYAVYHDMLERGYTTALEAPVLDRDEFHARKDDIQQRFLRVQKYFPHVRGFSLHLVCGLDRPAEVDRNKKAVFADLRAPRYFFECALIDEVTAEDNKDAHATSRREVASLKAQAAYLSEVMSADELQDYFDAINAEFEFDGTSVFALLEQLCTARSDAKDRIICAWGAQQTELYSPAVIEGFNTLMSQEEPVSPAHRHKKEKTPMRAGDPKFKTAKAAREYFYERAAQKLTWLYPEITPFEKEALRTVLIYRSDFHAQARKDMLFLSVMSGLLTINDAEILLALGPDRKSSVEDHLALFGLEAVYKNVQREIEVMAENGLAKETILDLLSDGISYAMITDYAERKKRSVAYILDLGRTQGFHATDVLDAEYADYEWEEPVLIVSYGNGKKEAYVTFRGVKYSFSVNDESRYFESLAAGKILFKGTKERIIIEDALHDESWTFEFKDSNGRVLLCDLAGVPIGEDIYYETVPHKKHATNLQITQHIPAWAAPSDAERCVKKIATLGSYTDDSTRKACLKRLNTIIAFMDKSPELPSRLEERLLYIAEALGNTALEHYFQMPRTKSQINDAFARFYSDQRIAFKEELFNAFVKRYYEEGKDSRRALEKTVRAREDIAAYGKELFITLFGQSGEDLDAVAARLERLLLIMKQDGREYSGASAVALHKDKDMQEIEREAAEPRADRKRMAFFHYTDKASADGPVRRRILMAEIDVDFRLQPHALARFPNRQTVRNELKQRRRSGTDYIDILKKPNAEGGDIGLYKACLDYGIPVRSRGRSRQYHTVREALEALLLVDRDKRYATELKKSDSQGGNSWLKVCCDRMGIPLPVNSLEKYPTKESTIEGYRMWKAQYPDKRITATFLIEHDPALLHALRRERVPYDMGIRRGEYTSIDEVYAALMDIPDEERSVARLNRNNEDGGNRHLLAQYYKNRVALNTRGCFLTRAARERKYPDKETAQKKVEWYRRHYGRCSAKMLQQKSAAGGDMTLLIACREFDVPLDRATHTSRAATDGYARYKAEVFELRDALKDEDIELLWHMTRDGDEDARAQYIAYFLPVVIDSVEGGYNASGSVKAEWAYARDDKISRGNLSIVSSTARESAFDTAEFTRMYKGEEKALAFAYLLSHFIPVTTDLAEFDSSDWQDVPEWLNQVIESDVPYRVMANYETLPSAETIAIKEELSLIIKEITGRVLDLTKHTPLETAALSTELRDLASHLDPAEQKRLKRLILESYFPRLCPQSPGEWHPGRKQGLEECMRARIRAAVQRSDMYTFGDKKVTDQFSKPSGTATTGSESGSRQLTLEDRLGTEDTDALERLEYMKARLLQIKRGDYSFLWDSEFAIDQSVLVSQAEKDDFLKDLAGFFADKDIFKGFDLPFGVWLVGSLGHIGLARKDESDVNLLIVADAPEAQVRAMMDILSTRLGGSAVYRTDQESFLFHLGRDARVPDSRAADPDLVRLCQRHDLGRPSSLATVEAVSTHAQRDTGNVAINRARFHIDEVLCEVGENARLVLASGDGAARDIRTALVSRRGTDGHAYEYFMAEYLLSFFAKQVMRLKEYDPSDHVAVLSGERQDDTQSAAEDDTSFFERVITESLAKEPASLDATLLASLIQKIHDDEHMPHQAVYTHLERIRERIVPEVGDAHSALIVSKEFIDLLEGLSEEDRARVQKLMRVRAFSFNRIIVVCDNGTFHPGAAQSLEAALEQIARLGTSVFGVPARAVETILLDTAQEYADLSFLGAEALTHDRIVVIGGAGHTPFDRIIKKMVGSTLDDRIRVIDHIDAMGAIHAAAIMRTITDLFTDSSTPRRRILTAEAWIKLGYFYGTQAGFDALRIVSDRLSSTGMLTPMFTTELEDKLTDIAHRSRVRTAA